MSRDGDVEVSHVPVMAAEVVELFAAGAARASCSTPPSAAAATPAPCSSAYPHLQVVGLDQDPAAVAAARAALARFGDRAVVVRARFDRLGEVLDQARSRPAVGRPVRPRRQLAAVRPARARVQLPHRRAPRHADGSRTPPGRAADVVNAAPEAELVRLLIANGEARFAGRIARAIVAARPITTTGQLADVVRTAIPAAARRTGGHPARRVVPGHPDRGQRRARRAARWRSTRPSSGWSPGGRCVVLSYHSGEDRMVKDRFVTAATGGCICPPGLPCVCGAVPTVRLLNRGARKPSAAEVAANRRSESARLRAVERLPRPDEAPA